MIVKVISLGKTIDPGEETNADHICWLAATFIHVVPILVEQCLKR
jgi:hypothetical protein